MTITLATAVQWLMPVLAGGITGWGVVAFKLGAYKEKIEQLESCCAESRISRIEGRLDTLTAYMPLTQSQSPIGLTERGSEVLLNSGTDKFINNYFQKLRAEIRYCAAETKYDIQECAENILFRALEGYLYSEEDPSPESYEKDIYSAKEWLFENGLKIKDLVEVGTVYLRDKVIEEGLTDD